jgi:hypothetical protein
MVETLGVSEGVAPPRDPKSGELNHWLLRITIQPEAQLPTASRVASTLIRVESGSILVKVTRGEARINVGCGGEPIQPDQKVVLEPGNMISLKRSTFDVRAVSGEPAVLLATILVPGDDFLCWICPVPWLPA